MIAFAPFQTECAPCLAGSSALVTLLTLNVRAAEDDHFSKIVGPALKRHCVQCHGADGELEGDVKLFELRGTEGLNLIPFQWCLNGIGSFS